MFNGNIFVSHLFCLVFCMDQNIVQVLADICLSALYLRAFSNGLLHSVDEEPALYAHFFKQLQDQAVVLRQQSVEQMLLGQFLVAVVRCDLFTVLDCLQRILRKFIDIHGHPSLLTTTCFRVL